MEYSIEEILEEGLFPLSDGKTLIPFDEYVSRSLVDMPFYTENTLWIESDLDGLTRLKANPMQLKFETACQQMLDSVGFIRMIILKARRFGFSTWIQARGFRRMHLMENQKFATVAHNTDATQEIFNMSKFFYDMLPQHPLILPHQGKANEKEMFFDDVRNRLRVFTAGGKEIMRSAGNNILHLSELAFWQNSAKNLKSSKQTLRKGAGSELYKESTANGVAGDGKYFYDWYNGAYDPRHPEKLCSNDYWRIFFAWFEDPRSILPFQNSIELDTFKESVLNHKHIEEYGNEEEEMKIYKLSWEQLKWRRITIRNECDGEVETFKQEYPSDDVSCFLSSSNNVFPVNICIRERENCKNTSPKWVGNLLWRNDKEEEVVWVDDPKGFIRMWEKPESLPVIRRYAGGGDISEGLTGGDYSDLVIFDRLSKYKKKVICAWHGLLDPDLLSSEIRKLSIFFNKDIWWCIERNNDGKTVLSHLLKARYMNLYRMHDQFNVADKIEERYGFMTSGATKLPLISYLNTYIREQLVIIPYMQFWEQSLTFIREPNQNPNSRTLKMGALNKSSRGSKNRTFDDIIIATALALEMDRVMGEVVRDSALGMPTWAKKMKSENSIPTSWMGV